MLKLRLTRRQAFTIAAVLGLIVAGLVYFVLNQQAATPVVTEPEQVTVVVATQDIPAFTTVTGEMVETREIASAAAPANAISMPADAIGKIAQISLAAGQTLTQASVGPRTAAHGLTFVIPKDHRAVTVALDPISGVGGFVYPGDRVDVLATFHNGDLSMTRTILQNVEVLAMNDITVRPRNNHTQQLTDEPDVDDGREAPATEQVRSATLSVAPDQAQSLILSAYKGSLHLVLRAREDESVVSLPGQTHWALMGMDPPKSVQEKAEPSLPEPQQMAAMGWPPGWGAPVEHAPPAPAPAVAEPAAPTIEIIRGTEREIVRPE